MTWSLVNGNGLITAAATTLAPDWSLVTVNAGDFLIAGLIVFSNVSSWADPTGFTAITGQSETAGSMRWYYRYCNGTETAGATFGWDGTTERAEVIWGFFRDSSGRCGLDSAATALTSKSILAASTTVTGTTTTSTPTTTNRLAVAGYLASQTAVGAGGLTTPTNFTKPTNFPKSQGTSSIKEIWGALFYRDLGAVVTGQVPSSTATVTSAWNDEMFMLTVTTLVTATRATTWKVAQQVTATRATTWAVNTSVAPATRLTTWKVSAAVAPATRATTYKVAQQITATRATTYKVAQQVVATKLTTWAVKTSVAPATRVTTWKVKTSVTPATRLTTWKVAQQVVATRATTYKVAQQVTTTRATTYKVAQQVIATRLTTWKVRGAVTATSATTWAVKAAVSATRLTTWAVKTSVTPATRLTTYKVAQQVIATKTTTYKVAQRVTGTTLTTWKVRSSVAPATRVTTYKVAQQITATRSTTFKVAQQITATRSTTYKVAQQITAIRVTTWNTNFTGPLFATLVDGFDGTVLNTSLWTITAGTIDVVGSQARLQMFQSPSSTVLTSVNGYDLTSSSVMARVTLPSGISATPRFYIQINPLDNITHAWFQITGTAITYNHTASGFTFTSGTYDPVAMAYLQFAHDGTNLLWQTSPDGVTWTTRRSVVSSMVLTDLYFSAGLDWFTGTDPGVQYAYIDGINTLGVAATKSTTWATKKSVTASRSVTWSVKTSVAPATRATTFKVAQQITATRATTYKVAQQVSSTTLTTWKVRTAVAPATRVTTWAVKTSVAPATRLTTYKVRAAVAPATRLTTWAVKTAVAPATRITTWAVKTAVAPATRLTTWAVKTSVAPATRSTTYKVAQQVVATKTTTYKVAQQVVATTSTTWKVRTAVAPATRLTTYKLAQQVTSTTLTTWNVLQTGTWSILQAQSIITSAATSLTPNWAALPVNQGDFAIVGGVVAANVATWTDPDGWTPVGGHSDANGSTRYWYRYCTGNENAGSTFGWDSSARGNLAWVFYRGPSGQCGLDTTPTFKEITSTTTAGTTNSNTPTSTGRFAAAFYLTAQTATGAGGLTTPSSYTKPANFPKVQGTSSIKQLWVAGFHRDLGAVTTAQTPSSTATISSEWSNAVFILTTTTQVVATRSTTYNVRATVPSSTPTTWNVHTAVTATRTTTYKVAQAITATRATTWNIRQAVLSTRGTTFKVAQSITATRATTWAVKTSVATTRLTTYKVAQQVIGTTSTTWNTAGEVFQVIASRSTTYKVEARVVATHQASWAVRTSLTAARVASWRVTTSVSLTRLTTWKTRQRVTGTRITTWRVRSRVIRTRSTTWNTHAIYHLETLVSGNWVAVTILGVGRSGVLVPVTVANA